MQAQKDTAVIVEALSFHKIVKCAKQECIMIKKIHNPKANVPAVYIPCWLIQIPVQKISHGAKLLYGRLAQWSREDGTVYRSKNDLKEELGISLRTLGDLIKELKDVGLIDTVQPVKGGISHYIFYDHEWMYQPIKKQLVYKSCDSDPMQDSALPHAEFCTTPMQDSAHININKIKINKTNTKSTSGEAPNLSYTQPDRRKDKKEKSDYPDNHGQARKVDSQPIESKVKTEKSDYFENNTLKQQVTNSSNNFSVKDILRDNIFQIPEQIIHDWITNRKKKRAALTLTAWKNLNKELANCKKLGLDPIETLAKVVGKGWTAFEAEWFLAKEELTKYEAAKKRSIELEQEAERRKQKEIEEAKRATRVTKASEIEREKVRKLVGVRSLSVVSAVKGA